MDDKEIQEWKNRIDKMSHVQMARIWRFAPLGTPMLSADLPIHYYFYKRFQEFGGMTSAMSKAIGWGHNQESREEK